MAPWTVVPECTRLDDLASVSPKTERAPVLVGCPAVAEEDSTFIPNVRYPGVLNQLLQWLCFTVVRSVFLVGGLVPAWNVFQVIKTRLGLGYAIGSLGLLAGLTVLSYFVLLVLLKWLLLQRVRPGAYPWYGWLAFRRRMVQFMHDFVEPFQMLGMNTRWFAWYLRLMGMRIGDDCLVSALRLQDWDLVSMGRGCFVAATTHFKPVSYEESMMHVRPIQFGNNVWIGTRSLVQGGASLGDGSLVGGGALVRPGTYNELSSLKGIPANPMGSAKPFGRVNYLPLKDVLAMLVLSAYTFVLWGLPLSCAYLATDAFVQEFFYSRPVEVQQAYVFVVAIFLGVLVFLLALSFVTVFHRRIFSSVRGTRTLDNPNRIWFSTNQMESLLSIFVHPLVAGSEWFNVLWRTLGANIGDMVYINPELLTDADLLAIQDGATLDRCLVEPHAPPHGTWRMDFAPIHVGVGAGVGAGSLLVLKSHVSSRAIIRPNTRVVFGEDITPGSVWFGTLAQEVAKRRNLYTRDKKGSSLSARLMEDADGGAPDSEEEADGEWDDIPPLVAVPANSEQDKGVPLPQLRVDITSEKREASKIPTSYLFAASSIGVRESERVLMI